MKIDSVLLNQLSAQAKSSPRLRMNYDLRNSPDDNSQRMLNAVEPGTQVPIHRHLKSSETIIILRGKFKELLFDDSGSIIECALLEEGGQCSAFQIPKNTWHSIEVLESGTVFCECKDGPYAPDRDDEFFSDLNKAL
ncbi:MAG: WbuC family cupin fold metalloprotein [Bacteroidales bacterium]|nr:WbuC family cupin fold metalloprotein [Bacteroidales bacterium]